MSPKHHHIVRWLERWRYLDATLLSVLVLGVVSINTWWVHTGTRPPHWDMGRHLWTSLLYQQTFSAHDWYLLITQYHYYPPFVYLWVQPFYRLLGTTVASAVFANTLYIGVLIVSVYALGRKLGGRLVGLSSAVLVASYPMLVSQFKEFQLDAPLTAMVALALCLLVYSEGFKRTGYTLAFGVACGVGMITKWTFVACLIVPAVIVAVQAAIADFRERSPRRLSRLAVALLLGYAIASPWYWANWQQFRQDMKANGAPQAILEGDPKVGSWDSATWYLYNLVNQQLFLPAVALVLAGLVLARKRLALLVLPLALIVGTYGIFTVIANKDPRYTLPMLPALAVVSCYWISALQRRTRLLAASIISAYGIGMFCLISFGSSVVPASVTLHAGSEPLTLLAQRGYIIGAPTHEQWGVQQAFVYLERQPAPKRSVSYNDGGADTIWLNSWDVQYYSTLDNVALAPPPQAAFLLVRSPGGAAAGSVWNQPLPDGGELALYRH